MADEKGTAEVENKETSTATTAGEAVKKKRRGIFSLIWNGIFRRGGDDFEKRLQYITKEEASILSRMKRRSQTWRQMARNLILFTILLEVIAVGYAIMTARDVDLNWRIRAIRVLPVFLLPCLSALAYSTIVSFIKMCDRKDQKTLEKLRAERQAKIDELKEKTNYYITQQLIQRYDSDPAAKAAAATVLASKLGADSGLKVHVGDEPIFNSMAGKSCDAEIIQSGELRHRKHVRPHPSSEGNTPQQIYEELTPHPTISEAPQNAVNNQLAVNHYNPQGQAVNDGGWIARIAALLVGENPADSYALICGNCHVHNGLARREDFQFVTYYCPHCHSLNRPLQSDGQVSGSTTPSSGSMKGRTKGEAISHPPSSTTECAPTSDHREIAGSETEVKTENVER